MVRKTFAHLQHINLCALLDYGSLLRIF